MGDVFGLIIPGFTPSPQMLNDPSIPGVQRGLNMGRVEADARGPLSQLQEALKEST